ncbi:hypothetical protein [Aeromonas sp. QDB03]|uniref:hypothetical protein n=1 Tax=Aeromonas sp. QDB03 TaxID=2989839 RepID=UPI0022E85735|nr:hypothetical protein [Aeromonas sp. QDB03]
MRKSKMKESSNKRSIKQALRTKQTTELVDSDSTRQATERKRVSKNRVVESGFKPVTLNLDSTVIALLHDIYDGADLSYIEKYGQKFFKSAELSAMISYLITSFCDNVAANNALGYSIYLHKILAIVKFRKEVQLENVEQICDFLNSNKFKRYTSAVGLKNGYDSKWEPKHLKMYLEAKSVDEMYKLIDERQKRKKFTREGKF